LNDIYTGRWHQSASNSGKILNALISLKAVKNTCS